MPTLIQDMRYALRMLANTPAFTVLAVLTLALGIGASAAIFGVVNGFFLRPLPGKDTANLEVIAIRHPGNTDAHGPSYLDFQDFRAAGTYSAMSAYVMDFVGVRALGHSDRVFANFVTSDFFATLGLQPALGQLIFPGEADKSGVAPTVILSYPYWQQRFGGDSSILGTSIFVNGKPATIVGVAPRGFFGPYTPAEISVFLPFGLSSPDVLTDRAHHGLHILARPRPGISRGEERAALQLVEDNLAKAFPDTNKGISVAILSERISRPEPSASSNTPVILTVFLAMVVLVLVVTCMNVTNLLLVRASRRSKELAVRAALGAGRFRLIRQLLTESLILAVFGGIAGAAIGQWLARLASAIRLPGTIPLHADFGFDWQVFAAIAAVVSFSGIFAGIVPAWRASRTDINESLREGGRSDSAGSGRSRLRGALVVAQVAGSCIVLIVAGLFLRSLQSAERADLGFHAEGVLIASVDLSQFGYDESRGRAFYRDLITRVGALPGVESASTSFSVPMGNDNVSDRIWKEGQQGLSVSQIPNIGYNLVGPEYLQTMSIPLLRGRNFNARDEITAVPVAIINESMARQLWPGEDPLGHHFHFKKPDGTEITVVGVARNGKYDSIFEDPQPFFYMPEAQNYTAHRVIQTRTNLPLSSISPQMERIVRSLDPDLPVYDQMPMTEALNGGNGFFLLRLGALFAGALGGLSLLLATIGVYGVISYVTSQRTHEVGIRMALGAQKSQILSLVLRQGIVLVGIGLLIGIGVSLGAAQLLRGLFFQISSFDPVTFGGVCFLLAGVAAIACYLPSRRATRVDPLIALRHD